MSMVPKVCVAGLSTPILLAYAGTKYTIPSGPSTPPKYLSPCDGNGCEGPRGRVEHANIVGSKRHHVDDPVGPQHSSVVLVCSRDGGVHDRKGLRGRVEHANLVGIVRDHVDDPVGAQHSSCVLVESRDDGRDVNGSERLRGPCS